MKVYDVADVDGIAFISMEYVDGQTLRQVLTQNVLRPKEALQYAIQIAKALAAAHDLGIVHRDVKPGNIMVTRKNVIKVVDFGLARPLELKKARLGEEAPTSSVNIARLPEWGGQICGTLGYMSPEQIQGLHTDARCDIFSFGVVLYEMLMRVRPFDAPTEVGIIANTLHADPRPVRETVPQIPEELDDVVQFCLRKDPEDRARSMHDIAHMLERARQAMEQQSIESRSGAKQRRWLIAGVAAMLALAAGEAAMLIRSHDRHVQPRGELRRMTWEDGLAESPALSSDGNTLAFASDQAGGKNLDIFIRHTNGGEPVQLTTNPADDTDPSISPDGSLIAFRSERQGGGIYVMSSFGGQERLIAPRGQTPRFSPDGKWIVYWIGEQVNTDPSGAVYIIPATGGIPRQLRPSFADARYPIWTPDGQHILFEGIDVWKPGSHPNSDWWVTPVNEGEKAVKTGALDFLKGSGFLFIYPPGGWDHDRLIFSARDEAARFLVSVSFSPRTWKVQGPPDVLTFGTGIEGYPYPAPSGAIAFASFRYEINVWSRSVDGSGWVKDTEAKKVTAGEAYHSSVSMSADGKRLAFLLGRQPSTNVWIRDAGTGRETAVTYDAVEKCSAAISADGSRVAWSVCGQEGESMYVATVNPDLSVSVPEKICDDCGRVVDWSRSGDSILFVNHSNPIGVGIFSLPSGSRTTISSSHFNLGHARFSTTGDWIAVAATKERSDHAQIFAIHLQDGKPAPESAWIPITNGDFWDDNPVWSERGDAVLFYSRRDGFGCIWRQGLNGATRRPEGDPTEVIKIHGGRLSIKQLVGQLPSLFLINDQLLFNALERTGSIWVLDPGETADTRH